MVKDLGRQPWGGRHLSISELLVPAVNTAPRTQERKQEGSADLRTVRWTAREHGDGAQGKGELRASARLRFPCAREWNPKQAQAARPRKRALRPLLLGLLSAGWEQLLSCPQSRAHRSQPSHLAPGCLGPSASPGPPASRFGWASDTGCPRGTVARSGSRVVCRDGHSHRRQTKQNEPEAASPSTRVGAGLPRPCPHLAWTSSIQRACHCKEGPGHRGQLGGLRPRQPSSWGTQGVPGHWGQRGQEGGGEEVAT